MTRVLVVAHEPQLVRSLEAGLTSRNYGVDTAHEEDAALRLVAARDPDAVLLDLCLGGVHELALLRALRGRTPAPLLAISARHEPEELAEVLDAGADDHLARSFSMVELLARLRAAMRRCAPVVAGRPATVTTDAFTVDLAARKIHRGGRPVRLTPTEWHVLEALLRTPGLLVSRQQLLEEVWGSGHHDKTNYLRVYMAQLRHKLERDPAHPRHLITEPGMGYRFEL
ncbi:winged helix-turn-helix domain-containing protein [Streptomyces sp. ODS28]|uniref:winged helix-turn-helix domain-containing protein n=1 Tax=Streptomyces sp. ODS28 TaxID=3136688 RepID=UPI0031E67131